MAQNNPLSGDDGRPAGLSVYVANTDDTRFNIIGSEMQVVNVELAPNKCEHTFFLECETHPMMRVSLNLI